MQTMSSNFNGNSTHQSLNSLSVVREFSIRQSNDFRGLPIVFQSFCLQREIEMAGNRSRSFRLIAFGKRLVFFPERNPNRSSRILSVVTTPAPHPHRRIIYSSVELIMRTARIEKHKQKRLISANKRICRTEMRRTG